jgi:hypothetical protein
MTDINEILLRITGDDDDAKRVLEGLITALEAVDKIDAEPEVQLKGEEEALTGLGKLWAEIQALGAAEADPSVEVKGVPQGIAEIAVLAASLESLPNNVNVDVEVDRSGQGAASLGQLSKVGGLAQKAMGGLMSSLSQVGVSVGPLAVALNPVTAAVLLLAGSIAVTLISALAALAASAALAVVALGALAVALAAAMAPIALIGIPALLSFAKILKVLKQEETEAGNAARDKAKADQEAVTYSRQHADASRALAQAVQAERTAVVNAMREMEDAIEAVSDSYRSLERAKLSEERAKLNTKQAQADLKGFRREMGALGTDFDGLFKKFTDVDFKGDTSDIIGALTGGGVQMDAGGALDFQDKILAVKEAKLAEKEATDGVSDAERNLTRDRQDALKFQRDGIEASDQYRAAQERVADATRNLARVEADRVDQLKQQSITESVSQTEALNDTEKTLLETTKDLIAAFKEAFGPGIQAFIKGIVDGLKGLGPAMKKFKDPLTELGTAMGAAVGGALGILATPEFGDLFTALIEGATQLAPLIAQIFTPLFDLLTKIAVAAMPYVVAGFQAVADWLGRLSENTSVEDIAGFLDKIIPHLQTWIGVALALAPAFFDLIMAVAPFGQQLADAIEKAAKWLSKWLASEEGRKQLKEFFESVVPAAIQFAEDLRNIIGAVATMTTKINHLIERLRNAWNAVDDFLQKLDALQTKIEDWINGAAQDIVDFFGNIAGWIGDASVSVWNAAKDLGKDIVKGMINGIKSIPGGVKDAVKGLAKGALTEAGGILGISSPSKEFFKIGQYVNRGFELGIQGGANRVAKATARMISTPVVMGPSGSGTTIQRQTIQLPPAPGHDQLGDPRVQAEIFAREMARRGQGVM